MFLLLLFHCLLIAWLLNRKHHHLKNHSSYHDLTVWSLADKLQYLAHSYVENLEFQFSQCNGIPRPQKPGNFVARSMSW